MTPYRRATIRHHAAKVVLGALALVAARTSARVSCQEPPPVREIGRLERVSAGPLASAASALPMPGGRVLVNDLTGRRVLLFDSTLAHATVVADTTAATANGYGAGGSTLIRFRGDTALLINPSSLSMFVIGPTGVVARVMAIPRPNDAQLLFGQTGMPGFDARGRLVYFGGKQVLAGIARMGLHDQLGANGEPDSPQFRQAVAAGFLEAMNQHVDSSFLVRVDLTAHAIDTAAWIRIAKLNRSLRGDSQRQLLAVEWTPDPLPVVDGWAVLPDGSIAIVRGRDFHVDWLDAAGRLSSSPRVPFDWQRVSDERKQTLIDSTVTVVQAMFDANMANAASAAGGGGGGGSARGGAPPAPGRRQTIEFAPNVAVRAAIGDLPTYWPPFADGAVKADADGNVWIRTSSLVDGRPIYDIVNRRGSLVDRVQLPASRTIAGFGPGVVYMAVQASAGVVRLERARVK